MSYIANPLRSAAPVASYPFGIQNTTLLYAFRLADYSTSLQVSGSYTFNSCDATTPLLAAQTV